MKNDLADGASKLTISPDSLKDYYIEYIPFKQQNEFYNNTIKKYELLQNQAKKARDELAESLKQLID